MWLEPLADQLIEGSIPVPLIRAKLLGTQVPDLAP
jgi:hypothetical protein